MKYLLSIMIMICSLFSFCQTEGEFYSAEEALLKPKKATTLIISGSGDVQKDEEMMNEISKLINLEVLSISDFYVSRIPDSWRNLTKLKSLNFSYPRDPNSNYDYETGLTTEFYNGIPGLEFLTSLTSLSITGAGINSVPDQILKLTNLTSLSLTNNQLKSIPVTLFYMNSLKYLDLYRNQISEFKLSDISTNTSKLEELNLQSNLISEIPVEIESLPYLIIFNAEDNRLKEFPTCILNSYNLQKLYLGKNPIREIPEGINACTEIIEISMFSCNLTSVVDLFDSMKNLKSINLRDNQLHTFVIDDSLELLESLYLSDNKIQELFITSCSNLKDLDLANNLLLEVPSFLSTCSIQYPKLEHNQIRIFPDWLFEKHEAPLVLDNPVINQSDLFTEKNFTTYAEAMNFEGLFSIERTETGYDLLNTSFGLALHCDSIRFKKNIMFYSNGNTYFLSHFRHIHSDNLYRDTVVLFQQKEEFAIDNRTFFIGTDSWTGLTSLHRLLFNYIPIEIGICTDCKFSVLELIKVYGEGSDLGTVLTETYNDSTIIRYDGYTEKSIKFNSEVKIIHTIPERSLYSTDVFVIFQKDTNHFMLNLSAAYQENFSSEFALDFSNLFNNYYCYPISNYQLYRLQKSKNAYWVQKNLVEQFNFSDNSYPNDAVFLIETDHRQIKIFYKETDSTFENGQNKFSGSIQSGEITYFRENGLPYIIIHYKNGIQHGRYLYFFENGQVLEMGEYINGEKNGEWFSYFETGEIQSKENYSDGKLAGEQLTFYGDGSLATKMHFNNGVKNGEEIAYHENGQLWIRVNFVDGNKTGEFVRYYDNGKLHESGNYESDKKEGEWLYYNDDGSTQKVEFYKSGILIETTE